MGLPAQKQFGGDKQNWEHNIFITHWRREENNFEKFQPRCEHYCAGVNVVLLELGIRIVGAPGLV